jgi:hypothetical protein
MQDILRYGGIGLLVYAVARYLQNGYGLDLNAILAGGGGGASLVAGYFSTLKPLIFNQNAPKTDVATKLNDAELVDYESMRHLSSRFGKINDAEALELLRQLNDKLFKLHHPESTKNEKVTTN